MKLGQKTVAFVTGGATGLGEAAVKMFLNRGCKVGVADINFDKLKQMKEQFGSQLSISECDVSVEEQVKNAIEKTQEEHGSIHCALSCAGVLFQTMLIDKDGNFLNTDDFKKLLNIHLMGSVYVDKYAVKAMLNNEPNDLGQRGVLIHCSSISATHGSPEEMLAYGTAKAAVSGMQVPIARNLGKHGIRSVAIEPGCFMTPL